MDPKEKKVKEEELNVEETQNHAEEQPQNEQAEDATPLTHEEELEKELEKAQEEIEEQKDKYLRLSAEFDNYRKRTMKEKAELILNGGEKSLSSILPVVDDFERAIKTMETATDVNAVKEGVELIYNKFMAVLAQNGVKVIETKDQPLDTDYHEAIAVIPAPSEAQKGKILDCAPVWNGYPFDLTAFTSAFVTVRSGTAGNSIGAYSLLVPSILIAPVDTTISPLFTSVCIPPQVPILINVSAPHLQSSSIAIAADGPPIPVDVTLTFT